MLYPESLNNWSPDQFADPAAVYRGTPFWAWNTALDAEELKRQMDGFRQMGFGGAHLHVRDGLQIPYLSDEFMEIVRSTVEHCHETGMLAWLYDEDRWPSGFAGGLVTRDHCYRARRLVLTRSPAGPAQSGTLYAAWHCAWNPDGTLAACRRLDPEATSAALAAALAAANPADTAAALGSNFERTDRDTATRDLLPEEGEVFAFHIIEPDNPRFNNEAYVDSLNPQAIRRFIEITHERYKEVVGEHFGTTCPAIFTDEPQFSRKNRLATAADTTPVTIPWSDDFPEDFRRRHGRDLLERLPEYVWDLPDGEVSELRWLIHDFIAERFATAFADTVGAWCQANGLPLTGHMMEEPTLTSQTAALGDTMRSYRSFTIPGIDMLCDRIEFTTAKQCQSAVHQYGREGMLSELYGVTNYDFDFRGYKLQGDWQAALGVTVRVPHLAWVSMLGIAKRDYPPPIGEQSPWHLDWPLIEDHFSRVNVALTRGRPIVRIAVIHPVESLWLLWGPGDRNLDRIQSFEEQFESLTSLLLTSQLDFDFVAESLLPDLVGEQNTPGRFRVGAMEYDVVLIPEVLTLRGTTVEALARFCQAGGQLLTLGPMPHFIDAKPASATPALARDLADLYAGRTPLPVEPAALCRRLAPWRELELRRADGSRSTDYITQLREESCGTRWLFIARGTRVELPDLTPPADYLLRLRGSWRVTLFDSADGSSRPLEAGLDPADPGWTVLDCRLGPHDSLLLRLEPAEKLAAYVPRPPERMVWAPTRIVPGSLVVERLDPNVVLLDRFSAELEDGELLEEQDLRLLDGRLRARFAWNDAAAQPWVLQETARLQRVRLRTVIRSAISVPVELALERVADCRVWLNGVEAGRTVLGYFVDRAIERIALGTLEPGGNELELEVPFGKRVTLENAYLLGDFSVDLHGAVPLVTRRELPPGWGDLVQQGLPFYGGSIRYRFAVESDGRPLALCLIRYRAPLVRVFVNGRRHGEIIYAPYRVLLEGLEPGRHTIELEIPGNNHNSFAPLHFAIDHVPWAGPPAWTPPRGAHTDSYVLKPFGILDEPLVDVLLEDT
ncbi:MAG: hypothetical protein QM296_10210 [Bacillota bacterium]|nr:hypothetical protein [Bacillota bacterium]